MVQSPEFEKRVESTQYLSRLVENDTLFQRSLFQNTQPDSSRIVSNRSRLIIFCYQNQAIRLINLSHPKNSKAIRVQEVWKKKRFKTIGDFDQSIRDDSQDSNSFLPVFNTIAPENACFSQTCHQTIRNDWDDSKRLETIGRDWKRLEEIGNDSKRLDAIRDDSKRFETIWCKSSSVNQTTREFESFESHDSVIFPENFRRLLNLEVLHRRLMKGVGWFKTTQKVSRLDSLFKLCNFYCLLFKFVVYLFNK